MAEVKVFYDKAGNTLTVCLPIRNWSMFPKKLETRLSS
jgi:hypothetical protein